MHTCRISRIQETTGYRLTSVLEFVLTYLRIAMIINKMIRNFSAQDETTEAGGSKLGRVSVTQLEMI